MRYIPLARRTNVSNVQAAMVSRTPSVNPVILNLTTTSYFLISKQSTTSGYATWFTAGGCNPHRSLWRHWWRHNL